jgi:hypothetical protein
LVGSRSRSKKPRFEDASMFQHVKWLEESAATALVLMEIAIDGAASPTTTEDHRMHERIARLVIVVVDLSI